MRDLNFPGLFHALFPLLLFLEQFHLSRHVTALEIPGDILAHRADVVPGENFPADRRLKRHLE